MAVNTLRAELPVDQHLGGDAGVVSAHLPQRSVAFHPVVADQRVNERVLERMTHMEAARYVGRRDHDRVIRTIALWREVAGLLPLLVQLLLDGVWVETAIHLFYLRSRRNFLHPRRVFLRSKPVDSRCHR